MADDIKIRRATDNEEAIQNIKELADTFDTKLIPAVNSASRNLQRAIRENEDVAAATDQYRKAIESQVSSIIASTDGSKKYSEAMKLVQKEANKMLSLGLVDMYSELLNTVKALTVEFNALASTEAKQKKQEEDAKAIAAAWEEAERSAFAYFDRVEEEAKRTNSTIAANMAKFDEVLVSTESQTELDNLIAKQQEQYNLVKEQYELEQLRWKMNLSEGEFYQKQMDEWAAHTKKLNEEVAEASMKSAAEWIHNQKQSMYEELFKPTVLEKARDGIAKFGKKLLETTKNIMTFRAVMNLTNNVINGFKNLMKDSVKTIAEAEQIYSKLGTVFTDYIGSMQTAVNLSNQLGTSTQTAASALSTVGDLLQAQGMSTVQSLEMASQWVEKFQDIIAFKDINMSLEEFSQNFMSGAAGNLRNFRTFGSIVKESAVNARIAAKGLDTLAGAELELAKMTARAEIALEQQENAMGATEKEWNTLLSIQRRYAEEQKSLKENIGETFEPIVKWWTELKTSILGAANAAYEYNRATASTKNKEIWKDLSPYFVSADAMMGIEAQAGLKATILKHGLSNDDVEWFYNTYAKQRDVDGRKKNNLDEILGSFGNPVAGTDDRKRIVSDVDELITKTDSLFESLQSIKGVNFVESNWYKSIQSLMNSSIENIGSMTDLADMEAFQKSLSAHVSKAYSSALEEAKKDIASIGTSATDMLFGDADRGSVLEQRIESYKTLYKTMEKSGAYEKSDLESVALLWSQASAELDRYQTQLKLVDDISKAIESGFSGGIGDKLADARNTDSLMVGEGWSEEYASAYVSAERLYKTTLEQANLIQDSGERLDAIEAANKKWEQDAKDIADYYKYIEEKAAKVAHDEAMASQRSATTDYIKQLEQIEMTEAQRVVDDLARAFNETTDGELQSAINETIVAYRRLSEATSILAAKEEKQNTLNDINSGTIDYVRQLGQLGMDDYTIKLSEFQSLLKKYDTDEYGNATADEDLYNATMDQMNAFVALHKATVQLTEDQKKQLEIDKYNNSTADFVKQLAQIDMTDAEKTLADLEEALGKAGAGTDLYKAIESNITAFKELQDAIDKRKKEEEHSKIIENQNSVTESYRLQIRQFFMSDYEKTIDNFDTQLKKAAEAMDSDLYNAILESKIAFKTLSLITEDVARAEEKAARDKAGWDSVKDNIYSDTGFIGDTINTFTDDQGNWVSDLVITVLKLFEQTEEFIQLIETLDSVLGPILISFGAIVDTVSEILVPILNTLFPIIKLVAKGFVAIATALELAWNTISGIIMNGIGHLTNAFYEMGKWFADFHIGWWYPFGGASSVQTPDWVSEWANFDWMGANEDTLKEMDEWLAKIDANTLKTAENTQKSDYQTYAQLLRDKYITPDQYASLVGPNKYSSSTTMGSAILTSGGYGNATYITINGLTLDTDIKDGKELEAYLSDSKRMIVAY